MNRYDCMFSELRDSKRGAFIPFVMLGDPNFETSLQILQTLIDAGADALEVGIPYSDPVADGPVIQRAALRALQSKISVEDCFKLIKQVREKSEIPIGILTYANIVFARTLDGFYAAARSAGADSVLVADVPTLEVEPFARTAKKHSICPVMIVPPNVDDERLLKIARFGAGYTYVVTRGGVTGADEQLQFSDHALLNKLAKCDAPPAVLGFGISTPAHVTKALALGAAGAIAGSRVVSMIEKNLHHVPAMLSGLQDFIRIMKAATHGGQNR